MTWKRWLAGLLWSALLVSAPARADDMIKVVIHCDPADATVKDDFGQASPLTFTYSKDKLKRGVQFQVASPGYKPEPLRLTLTDPQQTELHSNGLVLIAENPLRRTWDGCRRNPLPLSLALLACGAGIFYSVRGRKATEVAAQLKAMQGDGSDPFLGKLIGNYRVVSMLGSGGMATVYRAYLEGKEPREEVALKIMHRHYADDPEFRDRFRREIVASRELNHPNLVRVVDYGDQDGLFYLVMELVQGTTLRERVKSKGIPFREAYGYLRELLAGLEYAHKRKLVHRDLKPENLMITPQGRLKIMDFGLVKRQNVDKTVTPSGNVMGTPAYIAPEQILKSDANPASDQYAVGIIAYELATGRTPFIDDMPQLLFAHLTNPVPVPSEFRVNIPRAVETVILKMLEKDPTRRFADVSEAAAAVDKAYQSA